MGCSARMERTVWAAARRGDVAGLRALLQAEAGVHVDERDDFGVTPLMVSHHDATLAPTASHTHPQNKC